MDNPESSADDAPPPISHDDLMTMFDDDPPRAPSPPQPLFMNSPGSDSDSDAPTARRGGAVARREREEAEAEGETVDSTRKRTGDAQGSEQTQRNSKRARTEETRSSGRPREPARLAGSGPSRTGIDALFDLNDADFEAVRERDVNAMDPLAVVRKGNGDGDEGVGVGRRVMPKLDSERLLGERGLPALVKQCKKFKIKGKGHEATDLNNLLNTYQLWAHQMFPKATFGDAVGRIENLCKTRQMKGAMFKYRQEEQEAKAQAERIARGIVSPSPSPSAIAPPAAGPSRGSEYGIMDDQDDFPDSPSRHLGNGSGGGNRSQGGDEEDDEAAYEDQMIREAEEAERAERAGVGVGLSASHSASNQGDDEDEAEMRRMQDEWRTGSLDLDLDLENVSSAREAEAEAEADADAEAEAAKAEMEKSG